MPNFKRVAEETVKALKKIVRRHDRAAAEEEPGFTCGCLDCRDALRALEVAEEDMGEYKLNPRPYRGDGMIRYS